MEKDKKKTLTITSDLKKKIDTSAINTDGKQSFSVKKKEPFRGNKSSNRPNQTTNQSKNKCNLKSNINSATQYDLNLP